MRNALTSVCRWPRGSTHDLPTHRRPTHDLSPLGNRLRVICSLTVAAAVHPGSPPRRRRPRPSDALGVYVGTLDAPQLEKLRAVGIDQ